MAKKYDDILFDDIRTINERDKNLMYEDSKVINPEIHESYLVSHDPDCPNILYFCIFGLTGTPF